MFGYAHHALLGILVVAIVSLVGVRVLTATHAETPTAANIGDAVSVTLTPDQLQTLDTTSEAVKCDNSPASNETELTSLNIEVAKEINAYRATHHVKDAKGNTVTPRPLKTKGYSGAELHASAKQHTIEMGKYGYNDHNTPKHKVPCHPNGWAWNKRIMHYYPQFPKTATSSWTAGENILYDTPDISAKTAVRWWAGDYDHRRNMLDPAFRDLGVSAVHVTDAPGVYQGYTVTIITADFGARHQ